MPAETVIALSGVLATFAFFAATLIFVDMTWQPATKRASSKG